MKSNLKCYLTDHLAGAAAAIRMLQSLQAHFGTTEIGRFARDILREIQADEAELQRLIRAIDGESGNWKRALARFFSGLGARKFVSQQPASLGAFEAFEALALGIMGKQALWTTLAALAEPRFAGTDFGALSRRAVTQHAAVEAMRFATGKQTFAEQR